MYISLLSLIYIQQIYALFKKYYAIAIPILLSLVYVLPLLHIENSKIFFYLSLEKLPFLYDTILSKGQHIVKHLNREASAINELMYLSLFFMLLMSLHLLWTIKQKQSLKINSKIYIFIVISSLFLLIPLYSFSSGLFGIITRDDVVHRMYYSSSIFLFLPLFIYYLSKVFKFKCIFVHISLFLILISTALYSKYMPYTSHNYYKNLQSIKHSLKDKNLDFHLSEANIISIGKVLQNDESNNLSKKPLFYYARTDIAFVIKFLYHKEVYWEGRRANPNHKQAYLIHTATTKTKILFQTPKDFPDYVPFF